jgi:hypothetical protein
VKFSNCLCECHIILLDGHYELSQTVYVNTSLFWVDNVNFSDSCECYFIVLKWPCELIILWTYQIVYLNVTYLSWIDIMKFSHCSCECYICFKLTMWTYQIVNISDCLYKRYILVLDWHYEVLILFMWMLHCFKLIMWTYQIVKTYQIVCLTLHTCFGFTLWSSHIFHVNVTLF